jgi:hypothetical protein
VPRFPTPWNALLSWTTFPDSYRKDKYIAMFWSIVILRFLALTAKNKSKRKLLNSFYEANISVPKKQTRVI